MPYGADCDAPQFVKREREASHGTGILLTVVLSIALTLPLRSVGTATPSDRRAGGTVGGHGALAIRYRTVQEVYTGVTRSLFSPWTTTMFHRGHGQGTRHCGTFPGIGQPWTCTAWFGQRWVITRPGHCAPAGAVKPREPGNVSAADSPSTRESLTGTYRPNR